RFATPTRALQGHSRRTGGRRTRAPPAPDDLRAAGGHRRRRALHPRRARRTLPARSRGPAGARWRRRSRCPRRCSGAAPPRARPPAIDRSPPPPARGYHRCSGAQRPEPEPGDGRARIPIPFPIRPIGGPLKTYEAMDIRNVLLVAHGGAGKTTLLEAMLFTSGATTRMGTIEDGNTVSDFEPEEIKKAISVSLGMAPIEWNGVKINVLDAPGYADFIGDVRTAIRAVDAVVLVVSAVDGVEVQTEVAWEL